MATQAILTYYINWPNKDQLLEATGGPGFGAINGTVGDPGPPTWLVRMSPAQAAATFSAPITVIPAAYVCPSVTSDYFISDKNYPRDQYQFSKTSGGWFGIGALFGKTVDYTWIGYFVFGGPTVATDSPVPGEALVAMAQRRWIDGFEVPSQGEYGSGNAGNSPNRAASRTVEGYGLHLDSASLQKAHSSTECGAAATNALWERLYVRCKKYPAASTPIWRITGTVSSAGAEIEILPSGQITISNMTSVSVQSVLATVDVLPLGEYEKWDIVYLMGTGGYLQLFRNGTRVAYITAFAADGLLQIQNHSTSTIGSSAGNTAIMQYDDWICSAHPTAGALAGLVGAGLRTAPGLDWNNGSHVKRISATAFAATHGAWTGGYYLGRQQPEGGQGAEVATSIVASARFAVTTDANLVADGDPHNVGIAAMNVNVLGTRGTNNGQLGYKLPSAAEVLATVTQAVGISWGSGGTSVMYRPTGLIQPLKPLTGLELSYVKGADIVSASIQHLSATIECIGQFGIEDNVIQSDEAATDPYQQERLGTHNAPYPRTVWAKSGPRPSTPLALHSGTYTGNGTVQNLVFRHPVHFLFLRQDVANTPNVMWWSSLMGMHQTAGQYSWGVPGIVEAVANPLTPAAEGDQELQGLVKIGGAAALTCNAAATAYRYFAFMDPGMRFSIAGVLDSYVGTPSADVINALPDDAFTPEAVLLQREDNGGLTTVGFGMKGPGHTASNMNIQGAAETASLAMGAGTLTQKNAAGLGLNNAVGLGFMAFRTDDGSDDVNRQMAVQVATWLGDGSASRTVSLPHTTLKRPLFAIVMGHNGVACVRDPGHLTTASTQLPATANGTTGITGGGIDSISVGSVLNTNAVQFEALVFMGSATAGNGGWSIDGEFQPIDPNPLVAGSGPWDDDPPEGEEAGGGEELPAEPGGDDTDFGDQCRDASTKLINQALSRIGISKRVDDIVSEQSEEAAVARLHYSDELTQVLRDFDWAFATRYADLVLVDGAEDDWVNGDWTYSYRAPINMVKARRLVNNDGSKRAFDPDPPPFRLGSDHAEEWDIATTYVAGDRVENESEFYIALTTTVGEVPADTPASWELSTNVLVYTNIEDPELEYTVRPECAAATGDALFKNCFVWRLAAALAPVLSRDEKKHAWCLQMYGVFLPKATTVNAQEAQQDHPGEADWIRGRS